jgi:hypothetical protein
MNDTMLQAIVDIPGEDIRRGVSRVSPDHRLARSHPSAFTPTEAGPPPGVRTRDLAEMGAQLSRGLARHERDIIRNRMREIEREDAERGRQSHRYESAEDRQRREFWRGTDRLLASLRESEQPEPDLYRVDHLLSAEEEAELERIDQLWEGRAPWSN